VKLIEHWMPGSYAALGSLLLETFLCLGTAVLCGVIVGLERERRHKPAGVRTHILVCVGAAGFVHLGAQAHILGGGELGSVADFNRLVHAVATGIGFLGAGAIFRAGRGVTGVTTAASIWIMGAIGAAAGAGAILFAGLLTTFAYLVLKGLRILDQEKTPLSPPPEPE